MKNLNTMLTTLGAPNRLRRRMAATEAATLTGISADEAEGILGSFHAPGFVEREQEDSGEVWVMRNEVGILAYGSLQNDPGDELAEVIERRMTTH